MKKSVQFISIFLSFFLLTTSNSFSQGAGYLISFDGLDDYINVDSVSNDAADKSFTIEVWFKSDSGATFKAVFAFNQNNGDNRILIYDQLIYDFYDAQNRYYNNIPSFNEWNYLVVSLDTLNHNISAIINGKEDITLPTTNKVIDADLASIGQEWDPGLITSAHFKGLIDEIRISGKVLTLEEVRERMHRKVTEPNSDLIAYWQFDEGTGNILGDSSGYGNDGLLINGPVWMISTAPIGNGIASTQIISSTGFYEFQNTNFEVNYTSLSGNDTLVCTMINNSPEGILPVDSIITNKYWIVNKFGDGIFLADLTFIFDDSVFSPTDTVKLYTRPSRSDGDWTIIAQASNITNNTATFSNISDYGQFVVGLSQGISEVKTDSEIPLSFELFSNYPNPFNPTTTISWQMPKAGLVTLKIYDVLGREVTTLVNEEVSAGKHETVFNANRFSSGVYFYQLKAGEFVSTKKMILIK